VTLVQAVILAAAVIVIIACGQFLGWWSV
jgi:hypothetical protein